MTVNAALIPRLTSNSYRSLLAIFKSQICSYGFSPSFQETLKNIELSYTKRLLMCLPLTVILVVYFGGLDPALRVDNAALVVLKLDGNILEEVGLRIWKHIDYDIIAQDLLKIQQKLRMVSISFDRLGSGEAVRVLTKELPMREVISTQQKKLDIIGLMRLLFSQKRLVIHSRELYREIMEQEWHKSDAGNMLYRHPQGFHDDRFWALGFACDGAENFLKGAKRPMAAFVSSHKEEDLFRI